MLTSLALILLVGLGAAVVFDALHLPRIIGMLLTGILLGPCVLNALDPAILGISAELRQMALVIILLKAGLSLDLRDLRRVGRPAVLMPCLPAAGEIAGYVLLAPALLGVSRLDAAVMGAVLGAVSPAIVVPRMVRLMEEKRGTGKSIPQLILAGASCDGTLDGQGRIRFFGAETAPSFVFLIDGRQPACFVSLPGHDFRSRKTPKDFPASKNRGWRGRERRWAVAHRGR